jgi:hypothetical protein
MATSRGSVPFFAVHNQKSPFVAGISSLFLLAGLSPAQQPDQLPDAPVPQLLAQATPPQGSAQNSAGNAANIAIPAGTRLELVLTHPVDSHSKSPGDEIFAETSAPVIIGNQVAIPAGTYVQGKVEKLTRDGTRAKMLMQSVSLVLPNGYIVPAGGPVNIESEEWTAWNYPTGGAKAGIILAPLVGTGLGLAIGAATDKATTLGGGSISSGFPGAPPVPVPTTTINTHRGLMIGGAVGGFVGAAVSIALIARNRHFYIEQAAPMAMRLPTAIALPQAQVDDANQKAAASPPPFPVAPTLPPGVLNTTSNGICYIPGSPGTPGTHIPGTPGVNGSPGTPGIDIPGTPPTPPIPYPCPQ